MTTNNWQKHIVHYCLGIALLVLFGSGTGFSQTTSELMLPKSKQPKWQSKATVKKNAKTPTGVDFCLYQQNHVEGVTHPKGVQLSEAGPVNYFHLKPTFTLTEKHVKKCELKETPQPAISDLDYTTLYIEFSDLGRAEMFEAFKDIKPVSFVMALNDRALPIRISFDAQSVEETSERIGLGYFIDREFGQRFVDILNPMGVPTAQERSEQLYFPTVVGTRRVIQSKSGEDSASEFTETISKVEESDGKYMVTLNRENPANKVGSGKRFFNYEYEVSSKGLICLSTATDGKLATPEPLLMLPARVADMWTHEHFDAEQGMTRTGDFTVWGEEVVEVLAGKFKAIPIHRQYVWKRNGEQVAKCKSTTWYALGVGVVKHVSDIDGEKRVTELKEFTRGKAK